MVVTLVLLSGSWYAAGEAVPTATSDVGGKQVEVGVAPAAAVEFRAPAGWRRAATGDPTLGRLVTPDGGVLLLRLTPSITDFDGAAPRRLRELRTMGVDATYTEPLRTSAFSGRLCRAEAAGRAGSCAFVVHGTLGVTAVTFPGRGGAPLDLPALIDGMREVS